MRKVIDYKVLTGKATNVEKDVKEYLDNGWELFGGASAYVAFANSALVTQTVVKYAEEE